MIQDQYKPIDQQSSPWMKNDKYPLEVESVMEYGQVTATDGEKPDWAIKLVKDFDGSILGNRDFLSNSEVMGRLTTTDALQFQSHYCPLKKIGSKDLKKTLMCLGPDQTGVIRPYFKDRRCDEFLDCLDGSDERIAPGICKEVDK